MTVRDTPWPAGTPCWIDLMTTDQAGAREFYGQLFGWEMQIGGEDTGGYAMAQVDGRDAAGIGGMMGMEHPPVWNTYLATVDADATCKTAEASGATILAAPMDVLEFGRMAYIQLPGGGVFGLWQARSHLGCKITNVPGALSWNEFLCRDYAGAQAFYRELFGYSYSEMGGDGFDYALFEVDGRPVGGIGTLPDDVPEQVPPHWRVYFEVADCDAAVARAGELGGAVLRAPEDMPYGRWADLADPQGAMFSVIKSAPQPGQ